MGPRSKADASPELASQRIRNLLLVAVRHKLWPPSEDLRRAVAELRAAYPAGSAIFNFTADRRTGLRAAWIRMSDLMFCAAEGTPDQVHLGTAHLLQPNTSALRAVPMRLLLLRLERQRGDFAKYGNKVVASIDDAALWLDARLSNGPEAWTVHELRAAIQKFVDDNPLPDRYLVDESRA